MFLGLTRKNGHRAFLVSDPKESDHVIELIHNFDLRTIEVP